MADGLDEFEAIARHFAPLADSAVGRNLRDDAAVWRPPAGASIVLTCDAVVEGVHFLPTDPIDTVAQKALRVNLSDLAAKGAAPIGYLLTLVWPKARPAADLAGLALGLARDQARFGLSLWGGDTVATPGPLTLAVTMLGRGLGAEPPARAGARAGDDLWVSGPIGDGALGLEAARGGLLDLASADREALIAHYRAPEPRLDCAAVIAAHAHAAMDVSDGLLADAAKLAAASGLAATLELEAAPRSAAAEAWLAGERDRAAALVRLASGGDDYQVLAAAPAEHAEALSAAGFVKIGALAAGAGLSAVVAGAPAPPADGGFAHRLGR